MCRARARACCCTARRKAGGLCHRRPRGLPPSASDSGSVCRGYALPRNGGGRRALQALPAGCAPSRQPCEWPRRPPQMSQQMQRGARRGPPGGTERQEQRYRTLSPGRRPGRAALSSCARRPAHDSGHESGRRAAAGGRHRPGALRPAPCSLCCHAAAGWPSLAADGTCHGSRRAPSAPRHGVAAAALPGPAHTPHWQSGRGASCGPAPPPPGHRRRAGGACCPLVFRALPARPSGRQHGRSCRAAPAWDLPRSIAR